MAIGANRAIRVVVVGAIVWAGCASASDAANDLDATTATPVTHLLMAAVPLTQRQPITVRKWAPIGSGWSMRVIGVRPDVSPAAAGYGKPFAGEGVYVVTLALRHAGSRRNYIQSVLDDLELRGAHAIYANAWACIRPWRRTGGIVRVVSGRTVVGNVCFQDQSRDGPSMRGLFAYPPGTSGLKPLPSPLEFGLQ